jgi:hypothetical protein
MFKAIKEFFLGKPAQAPEVAVPYKVEAPAPVEFTPPPKAADVVAEAPVPAVTNGVGNVPLGNGSSTVTDSLLSVKPEPAPAPAPAKKPAARRRPASAKKPPAKKPVAK